MTIFHTSDNHFDHAAVIGFCKRPFSCVEEMNAEMVKTWNAVVSPADVVYHQGDFSWGKKKQSRAIFAQLNGEKHLIAGNHDHSGTRALPWSSVQYAMRLKIDGLKIYLSHYPVVGFREDLLFHGHEHNADPFKVRHQVDVGVDAWGFRPVSLREIIESSLCVTRPRRVAA